MDSSHSLLLKLRTYRLTQNRDPQEDFLTEAFCWVLCQSSGFSEAFLETVEKGLGTTGKMKTARGAIWESQVSMQGMRPDMICRLDDALLVFEHKIGAALEDRQIQEYRRVAQKEDSDKTVWIVTITENSAQRSNEADLSLSWADVYQSLLRYLEKAQVEEAERYYLTDFLALLRHEGLSPADPIDFQAVRYYPITAGLRDQLTAVFPALQSDLQGLLPGFRLVVPQFRYGRIGLEFVRESGPEWAPGVFVGCVLDGRDHGIAHRMKEEIKFQVILDFDESLHKQYESMRAYRYLIESLSHRVHNTVWTCYNHLHEKRVNRYHPIHIERSLLGVIEGAADPDQQKAVFSAAAIDGIGKLKADDSLEALAQECDHILGTHSGR